MMAGERDICQSLFFSCFIAELVISMSDRQHSSTRIQAPESLPDSSSCFPNITNQQ